MKPARVIVLVIAIAAGGFAALLAGRQPEVITQEAAPAAPVAEVLIASVPIARGNTISPGELRWQSWPAEAAGSFILKKDHPDAIDKIAGSIARQPFSAGEPIRETKLVRAKGSGYLAAILTPGMRAISTEISAENGAGGFILPDDHVDVILTKREKTASRDEGQEIITSSIILSNVTVLAIDQTVEEKDNKRVVVGKTATLELTPSQAETLARARQQGTIALALRSIADGGGRPSTVEPKLIAKPRAEPAPPPPPPREYNIFVYRGADELQRLKCDPRCQ